MRKKSVMEGFRILIGEPYEESFNKLKTEFLNLDENVMLVQESDGKLLLQYLSAKVSYSHKLPDLILLNLDMPVVDGAKTLELVRANTNLHNIPTIVYRLLPGARIETVFVSRGKQSIHSSGFTYADIKSFVTDLHYFLWQTLPDSGDPALNKL